VKNFILHNLCYISTIKILVIYESKSNENSVSYKKEMLMGRGIQRQPGSGAQLRGVAIRHAALGRSERLEN
jgi:hypothetical protein